MNIDHKEYEELSLHQLQMHYKYLNKLRHNRKRIKIRVSYPVRFTKENDGDTVVVPMSKGFYDEVIKLVFKDVKKRQEKLKGIFSEKHEEIANETYDS